MKIKYVLFVIALVFSHCLEAKPKTVKGKIIYENDSIDVLFVIPFAYSTEELKVWGLQNKVKFINSATRKKSIVKPSQEKEIQFYYEENEGFTKIRMISTYNRVKQISGSESFLDNIFLKIDIEGKMNLYTYYYRENNPGDSATTGGLFVVSSKIIQRQDDNMLMPRYSYLKKDLTEYITDCPEAKRTVENSVNSLNDIKKVVEIYNVYCK